VLWASCLITCYSYGLVSLSAVSKFTTKKNLKSGDRRARQNKYSGRAGRDLLLSHSAPRAPLNVIRGPIRPAVEFHYNDIQQASYTMNTTGAVTLLNGIAEGNDNTTRLGRKAFMRDVSVSGFSQPTGTTGLPQQHRVLVVWDNAAAGALPAVTDILSTSDTTSFPNPNNVARFTILYDQTLVIGLLSASVADQVIKEFRTTLRVDSATQYQLTTGVIGALQNGALLMVTLGSNVAGATAGAAQIATRVTFTDVL
jgi:hypothetical protein